MNSSLLSHFSNEKFIRKGNYYEEFGYKSTEDSLSAIIYSIYDGIEMVELEIDSKEYKPILLGNRKILEINYCHKGRMEFEMNDGCLQYIGEGDLFLNLETNHSDRLVLPLGYYKGVVVVINLDIVESSLKTFIPDLHINLTQMINRFFMKDDCLLISSQDSIQNIFMGLYTVPDEAKLPYIRLKIQELMIYLNYLDVDKEREKKTYTKPQIEIIKQIHSQLTENLNKRITIEELAYQYCISPTTLKSGFKGVYGSSIAAYMKSFRMKQGAILLCETSKSIAEIAKTVGYVSQSKFGAAFKEIMGISPRDYRKKFEI